MSTATERPILFSAPMVRAILARTKTQTRRVVKPQPRKLADVDDPSGITRNGWWWTRPDGTGVHSQPSAEACMSLVAADGFWCRYGRPGDRLWVRETWMWVESAEGKVDGSPVGYRADLDHCGQVPIGGCWWNAHRQPWRPSIHMPRWACRLVLEITDVRVQRLHEITADDAVAEGIARLPGSTPARPMWGCPLLDTGIGMAVDDPRLAFRGLWNQVNGKGAWDENPWVWAISFRRVQP